MSAMSFALVKRVVIRDRGVESSVGVSDKVVSAGYFVAFPEAGTQRWMRIIHTSVDDTDGDALTEVTESV